MNADLTCSCGSRLFSATPVFQTFPDGRCFELASHDGSVKNVWVLHCLTCAGGYLMGAKPKEHGNALMPLGSPEATAFVESFTISGVFSEEAAP